MPEKESKAGELVSAPVTWRNFPFPQQQATQITPDGVSEHG
jgi:hypothetical protein